MLDLKTRLLGSPRTTAAGLAVLAATLLLMPADWIATMTARVTAWGDLAEAAMHAWPALTVPLGAALVWWRKGE
jgi:hypothetical protein